LRIIWNFWAIPTNGTWASLRRLTIERWITLFLSSRCCTQSKWAEVAKISCDGSPPKKKGLFKVKSFFYSLTCSGSSRFPWKSVCRTQAPSRVAFFVWSAALGKILTLDNLRKQHVIMINKCYMCKKTKKFVDHLLHCDVASALWNSLFSIFQDVLG
jgi:hypothetical protein